jgi:hypothetical protein
MTLSSRMAAMSSERVESVREAPEGEPHAWIGESVRTLGPWPTYNRINELKQQSPEDLRLKGFAEILRTLIVRNLLAHPKGMAAVPKLTGDFLSNFDRFNLSAQEGYLVSLIDGRLDIQKLLILSPFDHFTTIFNLARLEHQKAITIP